MTTPDQHVIDTCRRYVGADYLPKIRRCLDSLSEDDIWWRPNERSNSVGNLVLHLAGNIRQWVVSGGATSVARSVVLDDGAVG